MRNRDNFMTRNRVKIAKYILKFTEYNVLHSSSTCDFYLQQYDSYEDYKNAQIFYNKKKIKEIWADEETLGKIGNRLKEMFPDREIRGICHGSRNGFEQNFFIEKFGFDVIGTDISDTATQFENSVQWDFHDRKEEWVGQFDFIYTNSHDQGWNPKQAFTTWLEQIKDDGVLIIEHTKTHGPEHASEMDPFGVRPTAFPYVMCEWFGRDISIEFFKTNKNNKKNIEAHIFLIRKNV